MKYFIYQNLIVKIRKNNFRKGFAPEIISITFMKVLA